ncbi:MAG: hypothetical protein IKM20_09095 [Erysipelotrichales bacterium]|nr:hypothetical protein [Erysipelotrichales bacterium]
MKIYIHEKDKHPLSFTIPNSLLFNNFTKKLIVYAIKSNTSAVPEMDYKLLVLAIDSFKTYIKKYGHFDLVDIESSDGTCIKINI